MKSSLLVINSTRPWRRANAPRLRMKTRHFKSVRITVVLFHLKKSAMDEGRQKERQVVVYEVWSEKEKDTHWRFIKNIWISTWIVIHNTTKRRIWTRLIPWSGPLWKNNQSLRDDEAFSKPPPLLMSTRVYRMFHIKSPRLNNNSPKLDILSDVTSKESTTRGYS